MHKCQPTNDRQNSLPMVGRRFSEARQTILQQQQLFQLKKSSANTEKIITWPNRYNTDTKKAIHVLAKTIADELPIVARIIPILPQKSSGFGCFRKHNWGFRRGLCVKIKKRTTQLQVKYMDILFYTSLEGDSKGKFEAM